MKKQKQPKQMCFTKQLLLLFLVNQEKLVAVLVEYLKIFQNKFSFNTVTFQIYFQEFYLDFKLLLLLHFRFPRARIFQSTTFSHPFMVGDLGITRQLTRWELVVSLILLTILGCLRLLESSIKILGIMVME